MASLSVVVGSTQPWPALATCLDSLHQQAHDSGVELLVAASHPNGLPTDVSSRYPHAKFLYIFGATIFQLRAVALRRTAGEIVAITEDHCRVAPDWCRQIIQAHADWPTASVIGGVIENGAVRRILDWAHFFITNGGSMPPVRNGAHRKVALQATVSYKKCILPQDFPPHGYMEWMLNQELHRSGATLISDDRICVSHVQSFTLPHACAIHFHDSRTVAAFRSTRIGFPERLFRLVIALTVMTPLLLARSVFPILAKRRHLGLLAAGLPLMALLCMFRSAGAVVGFAIGAGDSPSHIH